MDTRKLKAYAPKARVAFMQAVTKRAAMLGLYENRISDVNVQGDNAIIEGRIFTRKQGQQRNQLVSRIENLGTVNGKLNLKDGFNQFINEVAFTWFNRLTAIRYMEINGYLEHGFRVLSKSENATFEQGFEILSHAADVAEDLGLDKTKIVEMMLDGDQEEELYREILLGQCHHLSTIMPFMFEKLDGATELLLPDNLTKTDSILKDLVDELSEDNWRDIENDKGQIEVIGWLYQFYISEQKEAVMGKVVKREDIPAATQLFTPNWIVKYLVQNSVGRQWLATYPESELKDKMEYYITPAEQSAEVIEQLKAITPSSIDPETIKVLDPACGSGHILVEVYEVLREIYLERGYRLREIPELILTKNIYGLDIDDRAAQMSAFALLMKAREDDKRIFSRIADNDIQLNIYAMQSTENLNVDKLWLDLDLEGKQLSNTVGELFAEPQLAVAETSAEYQVYLNLLRYLKTQFIDAKNLGSLINIDSQHQNVLGKIKVKLIEKILSNHQPTRDAVDIILPIVEQSLLLSHKYDVVVANPPYLGGKLMNFELKHYAKVNFENSKADLYSMFICKSFDLLKDCGFNAQVTMQSWMYLSSFVNFRKDVIDNHSIVDLIHLGPNAFKEINGERVQVSASIFKKLFSPAYKPTFHRLIDYKCDDKKTYFLKKTNCYRDVSMENFNIHSDFSIAYKIHPESNLFKSLKSGSIEKMTTSIGCQPGSDMIFYWWEMNLSNKNYVMYNKGGEFKRWYGNQFWVLKYGDDGDLVVASGGTLSNKSNYFKEHISWTRVSSNLNMRYYGSDFSFDNTAPAVFGNLYYLLAFFNSKVSEYLRTSKYSGTKIESGHIKSLTPISMMKSSEQKVVSLAKSIVGLNKFDWDTHELSKDFLRHPLIVKDERVIRNSYLKFEADSAAMVDDVVSKESEINVLFINEYQLGEEVTADVEVEKISMLRNVKYKKYGKEKFQSTVIIELVSYFVSIIMGRYSLDREGLIYALSENKGFKELVADGTYKSFPADDDGIVPLSAEEWQFEDDATSLFKEFVKTVWGEEHLTENLDFIAESLCLNAIKPRKGEGAMDTIRRYFSTQFYKDHLSTYKKCPIYWLFSSGKEKGFECLVYLHRYNESTLARMRTKYVTPLMGKMETQLSLLAESANNSASTSEKARLTKELKSLEKKQAELRAFDEELKHLAEMKISLDLDDGVKVNYGKFGNLLADVKAIHGKNPERVV